MRYLMGIDSGGSKTHGLLVACGEDGPADRWEEFGGNTNHHSCGPVVAGERIAALLGSLCAQAGIGPATLDGVCFAGAGIDSPTDEALVTDMLASAGCRGRALVCSDALAALAGANGALAGGMVLSGTGSIAVGVVPAGSGLDGACVRVGGWGYKLDDAGSGYGIAIMGLRAAYEALDGRGEPTAIGPAMLEATGAGDMGALLDILYATDCTPDRIARLAGAVAELDGSDAVAVRILDASAQALAHLATTLARRLGGGPLSMGLCGGMLENVAPLRERVRLLLADNPLIEAHAPLMPPVEGALILLIECTEGTPCVTPASI
ncbi:MAG: BadF/BadG/BcrA/BcrD ATPase family protein [Anaerolineae bacterium]